MSLSLCKSSGFRDTSTTRQEEVTVESHSGVQNGDNVNWSVTELYVSYQVKKRRLYSKKRKGTSTVVTTKENNREPSVLPRRD